MVSGSSRRPPRPRRALGAPGHQFPVDDGLATVDDRLLRELDLRVAEAAAAGVEVGAVERWRSSSDHAHLCKMILAQVLFLFLLCLCIFFGVTTTRPFLCSLYGSTAPARPVWPGVKNHFPPHFL